MSIYIANYILFLCRYKVQLLFLFISFLWDSQNIFYTMPFRSDIILLSRKCRLGVLIVRYLAEIKAGLLIGVGRDICLPFHEGRSMRDLLVRWIFGPNLSLSLVLIVLIICHWMWLCLYTLLLILKLLKLFHNLCIRLFQRLSRLRRR